MISSVTPLRRALAGYAQSLLYRPMIWLTGAAVAGVAWGGAWAQDFADTPRELAPWWMPLVMAILGAAMAARFRGQRWAWRGAIALAVLGVFAAHTFRRILAPRDDISWRCAPTMANRAAPLPKIVGVARGVVADYPVKSEFSTSFPLQVALWNGHAARGAIWVAAPAEAGVRVGDAVEISLSLFPLARPTNPGERAQFWRRIASGCWCEGRKVETLKVVRAGATFPLARRVDGLRHAIYDDLDAGFRAAGIAARPFPAQNAALLTAMVFGESGLPQPLPQRTRADFRAAGLSHLLVASGTQVTFTVGLLLLIASRLGLRRGRLVAFVVPGLLFYALLAGGAPSIWRASALGVLVAWALSCGRELDALSAWSAALLALLALDPLAAWSLSTQLTFAATWGLICLSPLFFRVLSRWGAGFWCQLAALSLGAQLAVVPITIFHFGAANIAGIGANFFAVPLAGALVFCGTLDLFLPLESLTYHLTRVVGFVAQVGGALPGAQASAPPLQLGWSWACYALFLGALVPSNEAFGALKSAVLAQWDALVGRVRRLNPWPICGFLALWCGGVTLWNRWPRPPHLRVTVFDVGQGESILIQAPGGAALIDGGALDASPRADVGTAVIAPALNALGVEKLDWLALTHADSDHCNGLASLAREIPVRAFLDGVAAGRAARPEADFDASAAPYNDLRAELARQSVPILVPRAGEVFALGEARLRVLAPLAPLFPDRNNNCLILKLEWRGQSVLFTGDAEAPEEERLMRSGADLHSTILKVGHHGSKTSSSPAFLRAVGAGAGLISCGRFNSFGHPNARTLENLAARGMATFRTDLDGALTVDCDTKSCAITTQR